jgi:hypothetical protein
MYVNLVNSERYVSRMEESINNYGMVCGNFVIKQGVNTS